MHASFFHIYFFLYKMPLQNSGSLGLTEALRGWHPFLLEATQRILGAPKSRVKTCKFHTGSWQVVYL